ncbi:hypothetical protein [uncultured Kordia sp.]|uniref:hypothetical protein n=1 Tax=uncultured Kordia sp. TaxID=507699 RepID=UPI00262C9CE4|nr:hypothetical protein [uncultured Kordia sp.]
MGLTYTDWKNTTLHTLHEKTASFDESLHKKVETEYFKRLLEKMATHAASPEALEAFQTQIDEYVAAIPYKTGFEDKEIRRNFLKKKAKIKSAAITKHKLVNKGFYVSLWMPLGMALGMPWGVAFGNIAFGLPIGLALGLAIGSWLDSKAIKEGRVV